MESPYWCHRLASKLGKIYANSNIRVLAILKKRSRPSDKLVWWTITFVLSRSAFFLRSADFPSNYPKGSVAHLSWSHSDASHHYMQITISNQIGNRANQYPPPIIENIVRLSGLELFQFTKMWRTSGVCSMDSYKVYVLWILIKYGKLCHTIHQVYRLQFVYRANLWHLLVFCNQHPRCVLCKQSN